MTHDPFRDKHGNRLLIEHPIPLLDDTVATVILPKDLTRSEADRIKAVIDTLVLEPRP